MKRLLVDVFRERLVIAGNQAGWVSVGLLLVSDKVLHAGYDILLETLNGVGGQDASKIWVVTEAFPVPSTFRHFAKRTSDRAQGDTDTLPPKLGSQMESSLISQVSVPCRARVDTGGVCIDCIDNANTVACILETETRETQPWYRTTDARATRCAWVT